MPALNPYLHFNGNAEEAFNFYKSVFGGEFATECDLKTCPLNINLLHTKTTRSCIWLYQLPVAVY